MSDIGATSADQRQLKPLAGFYITFIILQTSYKGRIMSTPLTPELAAAAFLTPMQSPGKESLIPSGAPDRKIATPAGDVALWQAKGR
jgi:hypothetical protein